MSGAEIVTVVGYASTLAGALGGVGFTLRYQRNRELRDAKRVAYLRWVQFAENLGTWSFQPEADFGDFLQGLHDRMAELDLVGSPGVRQAVRDYFDALAPVNEQVGAAGQELDRLSPPEQATAIGRIYRQMDPHRDRVLDTMRKDLDIK
jgi:hypothetical protein